ncbi:hypothetical protein [Burkholderia catarinensis]|uniref:hypothetical protein n=1 Tax=Burkholderia catarinensis TaxID=1108140 RepID=UPI001FE6D0A1|nr:hypothetical protein [Burkholderia catarinensis]
MRSTRCDCRRIEPLTEILDAGAIVEVSPVDGVHFAADQHRALGQRVAAFLQQVA